MMAFAIILYQSIWLATSFDSVKYFLQIHSQQQIKNSFWFRLSSDALFFNSPFWEKSFAKRGILSLAVLPAQGYGVAPKAATAAKRGGWSECGTTEHPTDVENGGCARIKILLNFRNFS